MSTVSTLAAACAALIILKKRRKRKRQVWVKNVFLRREEQSVYKVLMAELREEDEAMYKNFVRVTPEGFDLLLGKISQAIKKQDTVMRKSISCGERLALTLRFLATGDTYSSLSYLFRIPIRTISKIIPEVCSAILECLKDYMKLERLLTRKWTKHQLKHFLESNNVPFRADAFHQELFAVASSNKPEKQYRVDNIINATGHKVLQLPPYHCHYNPIEIVRNNCKRYCKTLDGSQFDHAHVKQVWHNALHQVTAEKWETYVKHMEKNCCRRLESRSKMGGIMDVEPIIINLG